MLQNKITILSTKEIDSLFIDQAAEKNILIDISPFIKTESIRSIEVQQEIEWALLESLAVVFTSVNAVEAVAAELEGLQPDWRIYCIGHATKQVVEKYFGKNSVIGVADNAKTLAGLITEESEKGEVFFFCGDQHRMELPDELRKNGIETTEIIVYQTILLPHKIEKSYNAILFFSPTAVSSFFEKNKPGEQVILFAIGETTATEIKKYSKNKILIGNEPSKKSLLNEAISFFEQAHH